MQRSDGLVGTGKQRRKKMQPRGEAARASVPSELIGFGLLWGTPEQVAGKLRAFGKWASSPSPCSSPGGRPSTNSGQEAGSPGW